MDKIIILIFLFVLCLLCYMNLNKINEGFFDNKKFILIDSNKSSKVIYDISTFGLYNNLDKKLRGIKNNDNITSHYINNLDNWTKFETQIMMWLCKGIEDKIPTEYEFIIKNIQIAKFKNGVEMDFPHTNGNTIFLSEKFIQMITPYFNENDLDRCIKNIGSVIIHETIHIWQRRDPNFFNKLYERWNFKHYEKIINSSKFKNVNRYNPDGLDLNWCFNDTKNNNEYLLLSIYKDEATNISHVNLIGIEVEKLGLYPIIPPIPNINNLNDISEFISFFGDIGTNNYHPNELSAEIISEHIINKMNLSSNNNNEIYPAEVVYVSLFKSEYN